MRPFILCLICMLAVMHAFAQYDYERQWKRIDPNASGEKARKTLPLLEDIYRQADQDGRGDQQLAAAWQYVLFKMVLTDNDVDSALAAFDRFTPQQHGVVRAQMLSWKAGGIYTYYSYNRFEVNRRSLYARDQHNSARYWDSAWLFRQADSIHRLALSEPRLLQTPSTHYGKVFKTKDLTLLPTMYDVVMAAYIRFLDNVERVTDNDPRRIAPLEDFLQQEPVTPGIQAYQQRLRSLIQRKDTAGLLYADLQRLKDMQIRDSSIYQPALLRLIDRYPRTYGIAAVYYELGVLQKDHKTALAYYEKGARSVPDSIAAVKCRNEYQRITAPELALNAEMISIPGEPSLVLVEYANISGVYLRLYPLQQHVYDALDWLHVENKFDTLLTLEPTREWFQPLPDPGDYESHAAEMKLDGLPPGRYALLASKDQRFDRDTSLLNMQLLYMSNISFVPGFKKDVYALHRKTGEPLQNISLEVSFPDDKVKNEYLRTNKDGRVTMRFDPAEVNEVMMKWIMGNDTLIVEHEYEMIERWEDYKDRNYARETDVRFYLDRAVYRPGQTVYFKGIVTARDKWMRERVRSNYRAWVYLYGREGEPVDSVALTSNAAGSFSGTFTLPSSAYGSWNIRVANANSRTYFSVEEYKRPSFSVSFDDVTTAYRTGDTVRVTGRVETYAGAVLNDATVRFRVFRRAMDYMTASSVISEGMVKTNEQGRFSIQFMADGKEGIPAWNFNINADATDAAGETHSGKMTMTVADAAIMLSTNMPGEIRRSLLDQVVIEATSAQAQPAGISLDIKLYPLQHPGRRMRPRYWDKPDQFCMTEEEFHKWFPNDVYGNEDDVSSWKRGTPVQWHLLARGSTPLRLDTLSLESAWYDLVAEGKDSMGIPVKFRHTFYVWDSTGKTEPNYIGLSAHYRDNILPGETMMMELLTPGPAFVLQTVESAYGAILETRPVRTQGQLSQLPLPVRKQMAGFTTYVSYMLVRDNRLFRREIEFQVKEKNIPLSVTVAPHRKKLMPGEKETMQLTVKGPKHTELLASMYDASLDAISKDKWEIPAYNSYRPFQIYEIGSDNFQGIESDDIKMGRSIPVMDRISDEPGELVGRSLEFNFQLERKAASMTASVVRSQREVIVPGIYGARSGYIDMGLMGNGGDDAPPVQLRNNFAQTAFFLPHLQPDKNGNVQFGFELPGSLTKWKFRALAHTPDHRFAFVESEVQSQRTLMIMPHMPRFVREGDTITLTARVSNLTNSSMNGHATLRFLQDSLVRAFQVPAQQTAIVSFPVKIPEGLRDTAIYRVTAVSGRHNDGEEAPLIVLPKDILVTESIPLITKGDGTGTFAFDHLLHSDSSSTLRHHSLKFDYDAAPVRSAADALPYLLNFPHDCAEQTFSRLYAATLAAHMVRTIPEMKGKFDLREILQDSEHAVSKLETMRNYADGGFPWFEGMESNRYVTAFIVQGIVKLKQFGLSNWRIDHLAKEALKFLDKEAERGHIDLLYCYVRNAFPAPAPSLRILHLTDSIIKSSVNKQLSLYEQGLLALLLYERRDTTNALRVLASLKENAFISEHEGMYWRANKGGLHWLDGSIETQSLLITAFATITKDTTAVDAMKTWLLRNRQLRHWPTTKATLEAVHVLMTTGSRWLSAKPVITITAGDMQVDTSRPITAVKSAYGKILVNVQQSGGQPGFGAAHWQYYERPEKLTAAGGALQLKRELLLKTPDGFKKADRLQVGDKVIVRITLQAAQDIDFVHLEDMRPACLEPLNVLSGHRWSNRLSYYETTKDIATHFFFDRLPKGEHMIDYPLVVTHTGRFRGGISTLESMYAPAFNAHSAGITVEVGE